MNIRKSVFIFQACFLVLVPFSVFAESGDRAGNGGDGIVCRNSQGAIQSVELLDFYEARAERGQKIELDPLKSVGELMKDLTKHLAFHEISLAQEVMKNYQLFISESVFLSGVELVDIPDSNHISVPLGCKVEQIAIQRRPLMLGEKFYKINKDIWDKMDNVNRAGLLLHELLFRNLTLYANFVYDSTYVRYLTSLAATNQIKTLTLKDYYSLLLKIAVKQVNIGNFTVDISNIEFNANNDIVLVFLDLAKGSSLEINPKLKFTVNEDIRIYLGFGDQNIQMEFEKKTEGCSARFEWSGKLVSFFQGQLLGGAGLMVLSKTDWSLVSAEVMNGYGYMSIYDAQTKDTTICKGQLTFDDNLNQMKCS